MNENGRLKVLASICGFLALLALVTWMMMRPAGRPAPSAPGYYSGPMRNKSKRDIYATDDGVRVQPPAGAQGAQAATAPTGKGLSEP